LKVLRAALVVKVPCCGYGLRFNARAKIFLAEFQVALALGSPQKRWWS
jgi:hypothetical protein